MTRRDYWLLFAVALLVLLVVANFQHSPGYMDADYYQLTGQQLAQGRGFSEPVIWNYLDEPQTLPHPSHAYWPPMPSLVAAAGTATFGATFAGGRVFFIVIAAAIAPLTARLAFALTKKREQALLAGVLACVSGFYLPYLTTTDSFGISMLLGGLFFLILAEAKFSPRRLFALGALGGAMMLTRAEGLLWAGASVALTWIVTKKSRQVLVALGGALLVAGPWLLRTWLVFGTLFSPAAGRTLWLANYDELFAYPASQLSAAHFFNQGLAAILSDRVSALAQNLVSAFAVEGLVFLAPLTVWAAWRFKDKLAVRSAAAIWAVLLAAMSMVYPFSGARGGFFHAAAALQPMLWALAVAGLAFFIEWGRKQRGWKPKDAWRIFAAGALVLALVLSAVVALRRLPDWDATANHYAALDADLDALGVSSDAVVMVNNPPGFALATGRSAIVIPNGGVQESLAAAKQFGATVLLLELNHPLGWNDIYSNPQAISSLQYMESYDGTHIFFIP